MTSDQQQAVPLAPLTSPFTEIPPDREAPGPEPGIALCLSGGGYRAMLFHLGALWRLNEGGLLPRLNRLSSVSGGSIVAGVLGLHWRSLAFDGNGVAAGFEEEVVGPVRALAGRTIDEVSVIGGVFGPGSVGDRIAGAYRKHLFGEATLQELPGGPDGGAGEDADAPEAAGAGAPGAADQLGLRDLRHRSPAPLSASGAGRAGVSLPGRGSLRGAPGPGARRVRRSAGFGSMPSIRAWRRA